MATIRITNLRLRTIIGIHGWEREHKQDIVINVTITFDTAEANQSDNIEDTLDYKKITKRIIKEVEASKFFLLEKLTNMVLQIVMEYPRTNKATVRIDKPLALRFADSVSMELSANR